MITNKGPLNMFFKTINVFYKHILSITQFYIIHSVTYLQYFWRREKHCIKLLCWNRDHV